MAYQRYYKKPVVPVAPPPERKRVTNPSEYQIAIFQAVKEAAETVLLNFRRGITKVIGLHVDALAGCGKTTTSVEKDYYLPIELRNDAVQVAFNSDIAKVLKDRVADGVYACTIHSLGNTALTNAYPKFRNPKTLDNQKYTGYIKAELGDETETLVARENLRIMMDKARDQLAWTAGDMDPILDQFELETGHLTRDEFLKMAEKVLLAGLRDFNRKDFGDMIAMPLYHNLPIKRYAVVSVDEYQDLCPSQHELLDRSIKPGGLMFTVGDKNQAIYLWRGADSESIDRGCARYGSRRYVLPRTYRCGKAIVKNANQWVPDLECPETAHEGSVAEMPIEKMLEEVSIGSFILSRVNAPLLKLCFKLIRAGIPANIKGRNVGEHLKYMIKRSKAQSVDGLLEWVDAYAAKEVERREKRGKDASSIIDTAECLSVLCEGRNTLAEVNAAIDQAFPFKTGENIVLLSSIHKAKGLEAKTVYVLKDTLFLKKGNPIEEKNLAYVSTTRPIDRLIYVTGR